VKAILSAFLGTLSIIIVAGVVEVLTFLSLIFGPYTSALFFIALGFSVYMALRWHEKHEHPTAFDDHLSSQKIEQAKEWWIKKGGEKRK
jgi:hypothetical protein